MRWHRASNTANVTNSFHLDIQRCLSKLRTKKKNPDIDIVTFFMSKIIVGNFQAIFFQAQNFWSGTEYSVRDASLSWSCFCGNIVTWTAFCSMWHSEKLEQKYRTFEDFCIFLSWKPGNTQEKHWQRMGKNSLASGFFIYLEKSGRRKQCGFFMCDLRFRKVKNVTFSSLSLDHPSPSTGTLCLKLSLHRWKAREMKGLLDFHQKNTHKKMFNG